MKFRTEASPKINRSPLAALRAFVDSEKAKNEQEKIEKIDLLAKKITRNCYRKQKLDHSKLEKVFNDAYESVSSKEEKAKIRELLRDQDIENQYKILGLANIIYENYADRISASIAAMSHLLVIIKSDRELSLFLANPQNYINQNPTLSPFDAHILAMVANDPEFNGLAFINRQIPETATVSTPVSVAFSDLNLKEYGSLDAQNFPRCIYEPNLKQVLDNSRREISGGPVMGMAGAFSTYSRRLIAETASKVREMKMGACHTFAQLALDHLLSLMEDNSIPLMPIKMVTHEDQLGSHTYLLIGHRGQDLKDLSQCIIVDPWAVAMGHDYSNGLFILENYPYPQMTSNLVCSFDSTKPTQQAGFARELKSIRECRDSLFGHASKDASHSTKLDRKQTSAIDFLQQLSQFANSTLHNKLKQDVVGLLAEKIKTKELRPGEAITTALSAIMARSIEKISEESYSWKGLMTDKHPDLLLRAFNNPNLMPFWNLYIGEQSNNKPTSKITTINKTNFNEIIHLIDTKVDKSYSASRASPTLSS